MWYLQYTVMFIVVVVGWYILGFNVLCLKRQLCSHAYAFPISNLIVSTLLYSTVYYTLLIYTQNNNNCFVCNIYIRLCRSHNHTVIVKGFITILLHYNTYMFIDILYCKLMLCIYRTKLIFWFIKYKNLLVC